MFSLVIGIISSETGLCLVSWYIFSLVLWYVYFSDMFNSMICLSSMICLVQWYV